MAPINEETGRGIHPAPAAERVSADIRKHSPEPFARQASWLSRRFGLEPHIAALVASLVFGEARP
jgi:hypothetical protein